MSSDDPRHRQPPPDPPGPDAAALPGRSAPTGPPYPGQQPDERRGAQDPPRPPDEVDELASALLDGELAPADEAAARQRPDVVARMADMAAVRESVRAAPVRPPAPGSAAREQALSAALAAFDQEARTDQPGGPGHPAPASLPEGSTSDDAAIGPVPAGVGLGDIEAHRRRRARRAGGLPRWLGAAAAVVLVVAVAAGIAAVRPEDGSSDLAESSDSADADSSGASVAEESDEGGESSSAISPGSESAEDSQGGSEAPTAASAPAVDLGDFASVDDLVSEIDDQVEARAAEPPGAADGAADAAAGAAAFDRLPCDPPPEPLADRMIVLLFATAELAGEPVDVFVVNTPGERRVVALDRTCAIVADRRLP